jgi:hypothetical protein
VVVCEKIWIILMSLYGGGPEIRIDMINNDIQVKQEKKILYVNPVGIEN